MSSKTNRVFATNLLKIYIESISITVCGDDLSLLFSCWVPLSKTTQGTINEETAHGETNL